MRSTRLAIAAAWLACAAALAAPLAAQEDERPRRGKIDEVEREASGESDSWGIFQFLYDAGRVVAHLVPWLTEDLGPGQGYLAYPYQDPRALEHFVLTDVRSHRGFGNLSGWYYRDDGSTLRGAHFAYEGARSVVGVSVEYDYFREPKLAETDYLHLGRLGVGGVTRLSHAAFLRSGLALRGMALDDGRLALGPEFEIGAQFFPLRPLAFDGTFRIAGLSGASASWLGTVLVDASAGAGVLVGRVEVRGGYRTLVIGSGTTLAGPTLGARIWF